MKKVLIIGSSKFPVPATKGGAVPTIIEEIIKENEKYNQIELTVYSVYDEKAEKESKQYKYSNFIWAKFPKIVVCLDKILKCILKLFGIKKRINSYSYFFRIVWQKHNLKKVLLKHLFDEIVFENSLIVFGVMKNHRLLNKYNKHFFYHSHSVPYKFYGTRKILQYSKKILCVSNFLEREYKKRIPELNNTYVIKNCVSSEHFYYNYSPMYFNLKYNIPNGSFVMLFVGRVVKEKGIEHIFDAMKLLSDKSVYLVIVGSSLYNQKKSKNTITVPNEIKNNVIETGYIDNSSLSIFYSNCDVVLTPSVCNDAAPLVNLESMSCGKAVITTTDGGIPEYVNDNCAVILKNDPKTLSGELANAIAHLKNNKAELERMNKNAKEQSNKFTFSKYYNEFVGALK